jgi:O-antigen/teichoic acid export membrane protein
MGFKKTFFKNVAVYGGYSYLSWFFDTLISTIILSRFLGPKEYGFVAIINIFSGFIQLFSNTGLSYAVIRSEYNHHFHKLIFNLSIWVGMALCMAMCLLAYPITFIYGDRDLLLPTIIISLQFFTNSFNIVPQAILEKRLEFNYLGKIGFIIVIITISMMIIMAATGCSYWSLIVPFVIQPIIRQILLTKKVKIGIHLYGWRYTKLGLTKVKTMFESISIFNFVNYFARNADNFLVGKYYGEATLGLYDRAYKFLYMARRLINSILGPVLFPSLINAKSKGEDIRSHFLDILGMINVINICIALPLILLAKPITLFLWGKSWLGVADFMPYVGAVIPLQTLMIAADDLYMLYKKERAYLTLGIPLLLILVAGIVIGAFFSALHIIRFYALALALLQTPMSLYFGHYRILGFNIRQIFKFWMPKVIITNCLIFSIWFGNIYITSLILIIAIFEAIIFRYKDILEVSILLKDKWLKIKTKS